MPKSSGLGANYYVDQFDLSNDTNSFGSISKKLSPIEVTGIDKSAPERIAGDLDADMKWVSYLNPTNAHVGLSTLPRTDRQLSYFHRTTIGAPVASMIGKQVGYDPKRDANGSILIDVDAPANAFWLDWGVALTAGKRVDTTATNGTGYDNTTVSTAFGAQGYVHLFAFTGTNIIFTLQDSADNVSFAAITGGAFTSMTAVGAQRIQTARNQTIRRYWRVATSGTFTSATFAVQMTSNITDMSLL